MRSEDIDQALRQQETWEPPPGFAQRVVRLAEPIEHAIPGGLLPFLAGTARSLAMASGARFAGVVWTLRQYRWLLAR
jgi:hypothetical protein